MVFFLAIYDGFVPANYDLQFFALPTERAKEVGSDPTAAGGGEREGSEWQRSADDAAALAARKLPGTATVHSTRQDDRTV